MTTRKGIILAGGKGTRLYPSTQAISKQLLPVYNKPMIYYLLSTLMVAGIQDILIIVTADQLTLFENLIGTGAQWGITVSYTVQESPDGIAQAFLIAEDFLNSSPCALILGDNIFHGHDLKNLLHNASHNDEGRTIFLYHVDHPEQYGVAEFNTANEVVNIEEKPVNPKSNYAITGSYFYDHNVCELAKKLTPSARNKLEITDLNQLYLKNNLLYCEKMGCGIAWLDAGTHEDLNKASQYIETLESRQGIKLGCPEAVTFENNWINKQQLEQLIHSIGRNPYTDYLVLLLK